MILGIDLGTSNSLAAAYIDGEVKLLKNASGSHKYPSVISISENNVIYTGEEALMRKKLYAEKTVEMFKRSMGRNITYSLGNKEYKAEDLSAMLLKSIKKDAEEFFGEKIDEAIISVPAFFNNHQRKAVILAGELAGFKVRRIVNEPTAAAIAYGITKKENVDVDKKVIAVLDLGGGTFDISIIECDDNIMEVVAVCGDNELGGGDFTNIIVKMFLEKNGINRELSTEEKELVWDKAQKAKHQITELGIAKIECEIEGVCYNYSISETEYEEACMDLLEKIRKLVIKAVDESKYYLEEITDIVLVGGGTRLSIVQKCINKMLGREVEYSINPDEAVVRGVALQGALINKEDGVEDLIVTDICPKYIGKKSSRIVEYDNDIEFEIIVNKNTPIPTKKKLGKRINYRKGAWDMILIESEDALGIKSNELCDFSYKNPELEGVIYEWYYVTYDINGLIYVEVNYPQTGASYGTVVGNDDLGLSDEEIYKQKEELDKMFSTEKNDENTLIISRAERMYEECLGDKRKIIGEYIEALEEAINMGKEKDIVERRNALNNILDLYE